MRGATNLKKKYFHGIGTLLEKETGYSAKYCRDVLNGLYDDRETEAVTEIKEKASKYLLPEAV